MRYYNILTLSGLVLKANTFFMIDGKEFMYSRITYDEVYFDEKNGWQIKKRYHFKSIKDEDVSFTQEQLNNLISKKKIEISEYDANFMTKKRI